MQNVDINYQIKINTGEYKGQTVTIETDLEELEETSLSQMLIDEGYLDGWCCDEEYTIVGRVVTLSEA